MDNLSINNKSGAARWWSRVRTSNEFVLLLILAAILIVGAFVTPRMYSAGNFYSVMRTASYGGLAGLAEGMILMAGKFDMSIGSIISFCSIVAAETYIATQSDLLMVLVTIAVAAALGAFNGLVVVKFQLPNFLATLGTATIFKGLASLLSGDRAITTFTGSWVFNFLGKSSFADIIPASALFFLLVAVILGLLLRKTSFGKMLYSTGANPRAAWISGIDSTKIQFWVYIIGAIVVAPVGFMIGGQAVEVNVNVGTGYELTGTAIAVLGGVLFGGGKGSILGVVIGAFTFQILVNELLLTGLGTYVEQALKGILLVVIVIIYNYIDIRREQVAKA